ncbi:MAG: DUF4019 domain-containing protein [Rhodanobacteraceae bacterium]|nr:DUF4019 domain-containing protein [Rhodanobacteraceae bacterium]
MKSWFALSVLLLCTDMAAADTSTAAARAREWLALVDTARYAEAWAQTGTALREGLDREAWSQRIRAARRSNSTVLCRKTITLEPLADPARTAAWFVTEFADGQRISEKVTLSADHTQILGYRTGPAAADRGSPCAATTTPEPLR